MQFSELACELNKFHFLSTYADSQTSWSCHGPCVWRVDVAGCILEMGLLGSGMLFDFNLVHANSIGCRRRRPRNHCDFLFQGNPYPSTSQTQSRKASAATLHRP